MSADDDLRFSPRPNRAHEIGWRPWGDAAFAEARATQKPLLLAISAVWCHWCHVMDETTYSDGQVIATINEHFVPMRIDNDRHPDVNRRYNLGGWPTTAFLATNGDVVAGATYIPPQQMLDSLRRVLDFFAENREALLALPATDAAAGVASATHGDGLRDAGTAAGASDDSALSAMIDEVARTAIAAADPVYGGFGTEPKFPQADVLAFLLAYVAVGDDADARERARTIVRKSLREMARRPIFDQIGGGFFRYATRRDWSAPHFEKMLDDNARLVRLYLDAAETRLPRQEADEADEAADDTVDALLHETGVRTLEYVLEALGRDRPPSFAGSQDADEGYYGLAAAAREVAREPFVDCTVYVGWNALAARALLRSAALLERPDLLDRGLALLDYLAAAKREDGFYGHYLTAGGHAADGAPLLVDQTSVAAAFLDAYEASGERRWLERAHQLSASTQRYFRASDGRMNDRRATTGMNAGLLARPWPALEEDAQHADTLLRLSALTGEPDLLADAREVLAGWTTHFRPYGLGAAPYAGAILRFTAPPRRVVIVGAPGDEGVDSLRTVAFSSPSALRTVESRDPGMPSDRRRLATLDVPLTPGAAYICHGTVCLPPARDAATLRRQLLPHP